MRDQTDFVYYRVIILLLASCTVVYCDGGELHRDFSENMSHSQCSPWFVYNPTTKQCECFNSPSISGIVKCTEDGAQLRLGYCMTYESEKRIFVSPCNYRMAEDHNITADRYIRLPNNITEVNEYMCAPLNSKGLACSECLNGFGYSIVSGAQIVPTLGMVCPCTSSWSLFPLQYSTSLSCSFKSV